MLFGCKSTAPGATQAPGTPFNSNAAACFQRLPQVNPAFRQGYQDLAALLAEPAPLEALLPRVDSENTRVLTAGRAAPPTSKFMEEDVYVCCVRDALEGRVAREAKATVAGEGSAQDKRARLQAMLDGLRGLSWSGPKWTAVERPAIEKHVLDALAALP